MNEDAWIDESIEGVEIERVVARVQVKLVAKSREIQHAVVADQGRARVDEGDPELIAGHDGDAEAGG